MGFCNKLQQIVMGSLATNWSEPLFMSRYVGLLQQIATNWSCYVMLCYGGLSQQIGQSLFMSCYRGLLQYLADVQICENIH